MPKTSTNILYLRYLYSRAPVRQVFSQRASDELDWSYEKSFYSLFVFWLALRVRQSTAQLKILSYYTTKRLIRCMYFTVLTKELTSYMYIAVLVWDIQVINSCATGYTTCNKANGLHKKDLFCYFPSDFRSQQSFGRWQVFSHVLKPRLPGQWGERGRDWDEVICNIRNIICMSPHGSGLFLSFSLVRGCKNESTTISTNKRTQILYRSHSHSLQTSLRLVYISSTINYF